MQRQSGGGECSGVLHDSWETGENKYMVFSMRLFPKVLCIIHEDIVLLYLTLSSMLDNRYGGLSNHTLDG